MLLLFLLFGCFRFCYVHEINFLSSFVAHVGQHGDSSSSNNSSSGSSDNNISPKWQYKMAATSGKDFATAATRGQKAKEPKSQKACSHFYSLSFSSVVAAMFCLPFPISDFLLAAVAVVVAANSSSLPASESKQGTQEREKTTSNRQQITRHSTVTCSAEFFFFFLNKYF